MCFLVFLLFLANPVLSANLTMVQAIWRHGDRAPGDLPYPNDLNNESCWPRGWDQLTNKGIWQAVELGIWLRQRYGESLLPAFNKTKVYFQSSESERAIQTAQGVAAGLFPPTDYQIWESSYLKFWQPIPIHTTGPDIVDPLLRPTKIECPNYEIVNAQEEAPVAEKMNQDYAMLFEYLQNVTGIEKIDYTNIKHLYDIEREIEHGMSQPNWVYQIFEGKTIMDHIREAKRITRTQEFNSKQKAKYRGGYLVNTFIENMERRIANKSSIDAHLYSAHDGTLTALLYALNVSDDQLIPYTGTVLVELYDDQTVQLHYKNSTVAYPLTIPGCEQSCPFDAFKSLLQEVRVSSLENLYEICGTPLVTTTFPPIVNNSRR